MNRPFRLRGHAQLLTATFVTFMALTPLAVAAHERWFVPTDEQPNTDWSALISWPVLIALVSGGAAVAILSVLLRIVDDPLWPRPPFFQGLEPAAPAILGVQAAITMIFEATRLHLFVPNIDLSRNAYGVIVAGITIVAAFSFITGVLTRIGALTTIALFLLTFTLTGVDRVAEQVLFVGIAVYLATQGRGVVRYAGGVEREIGGLAAYLQPYALTILRLSAGASVLVLAFTEKLLNVDLGLLFLHEYPHFNFMQEAGIDWFSDRRFVYAAGIVEATAGIALLSGVLPRVVILSLWIPFNLGIAFLPPQELIGHLPILATMYVLLVRGTQGIPPRSTSDLDGTRDQQALAAATS